MRRWRIVLPVVVLAALGVGLAVALTTGQPYTYETPLDGYACTEDPRRINISTGVGPGDRFVSTDVREDRDKVSITIRAEDPEYGKGFQNLSRTLDTVSVVLKDPLGSRLVVDQAGRTLRGQCP